MAAREKRAFASSTVVLPFTLVRVGQLPRPYMPISVMAEGASKVMLVSFSASESAFAPTAVTLTVTPSSGAMVSGMITLVTSAGT